MANIHWSQMSANDKDFVLKNTLWCVTTQPYSQGQAVKFDFMNKVLA